MAESGFHLGEHSVRPIPPVRTHLHLGSILIRRGPMREQGIRMEEFYSRGLPVHCKFDCRPDW
jgi:hypothetical protein